MPIEIRRFGVGHRRPDGPPGTVGVTGQLIHADGRGVIAELAFGRRASVPAHSNVNSAWFLVLEGGGFVRVGDEQARVAAGEAVEWPAGVPHAAWTDLSEMRAIVVELAGADDAFLRGIIDAGEVAGEPGPASTGEASSAGAGGAAHGARGGAHPVERGRVERGVGQLAESGPGMSPSVGSSAEGEPR